jgi:hypothetical protein
MAIRIKIGRDRRTLESTLAEFIALRLREMDRSEDPEVATKIYLGVLTLAASAPPEIACRLLNQIRIRVRRMRLRREAAAGIEVKPNILSVETGSSRPRRSRGLATGSTK